MATPDLLVRVDWYANEPADFTPAISTVKPIDTSPLHLTRGRSADFSGDATGSLSFVLDNTDYAYSEDRNWADNPSFEIDTTGWSTSAIASLTAAATSITRITTDKVYGSASASAVLTATSNSGVTYAIPYRFRSGITYRFSVSLKSSTGNLNVRAGLASAGTPADIASTSANITTAWATYSGTWTPSADRTDAVFFVRTTTAASATVLIDGVQVNPGATLNTYIEAPTKGQLQPGRPVHVQATYSATVYPLFFGYVERITPDPSGRLVTIECYDPLAKMESSDGFVPAVSELNRCGRDFRIAALEDYARGGANLIANPDFASNTTGWAAVSTATISRITTDGALGSSSCLQVTAGADGRGVSSSALLVGQLFDGQTYRLSAYMKSSSGVTTIAMAVGATTQTVTITSSWARYSLAYTQSGTVGSSSAPTVKFTASGGSATFLLDAVAFTRGQGLYPYGGTGRAANYVANGGFDVETTGWGGLWSNLVTNGSFETDTTGWAAEVGTPPGGTYGSGGTYTLARSASNAIDGTYSLRFSSSGSGGTTNNLVGAYSFSGTFSAGVTYYLRFYVTITANADAWSFGVSGDYVSSGLVDGWATATWTPSADRTGVKIYFWGQSGVGIGIGFYVDAVSVTGVSQSQYWQSSSGPFGTTSTTVPVPTVTTTSPKYGYRCLSLGITAANQGAAWDFYLTKPGFFSGQAYTGSVWLKSSSGTATVTLGVGFADGTTTDQATTSVSIGTSWTQATVTWTPSADRLSSTQYRVYLWVKQTDATARTLYLDGARVEPGSSAAAYELTQWAGLAASGAEVTTNLDAATTSSGTTLAALQLVNGALFSRHWIEPLAASPWWQYNSASRDTRPALAETITDAETLTSLQSDRAAYVTAVPVSYKSGGSTATYVGASESAYALVDQDIVGATAGSQWTPTLAEAQAIAAEILARYGAGHKRPQVGRRNSWPGMLARDLNDVVAVQVAGWLWPHLVASIERIDLSVGNAGQDWQATYQLEEWPYGV